MNHKSQEAVAIGRTFAAMKDYQLDGNREMVALGTMNIIGSMSSCYVATGFLANSSCFRNYIFYYNVTRDHEFVCLLLLLLQDRFHDQQ